ncbi:hypothetical protein U1Q18_032275 [Sarracenia purpurea var. burkii]
MAVELAKGLNVNNLHLEGDSLSVINAINSTAEDFSSSGAIIEEIKSQLRGFRNSICTHIQRMGNSVVHALSRLAISMGKPCTWPEPEADNQWRALCFSGLALPICCSSFAMSYLL